MSTTYQPGNVHLADGTVIAAAHVAIIGDGKVYVTTADEEGALTLTEYDAADVDHIDLLSA
jgi:hypothetical protein